MTHTSVLLKGRWLIKVRQVSTICYNDKMLEPAVMRARSAGVAFLHKKRPSKLYLDREVETTYTQS